MLTEWNEYSQNEQNLIDYYCYTVYSRQEAINDFCCRVERCVESQVPEAAFDSF